MRLFTTSDGTSVVRIGLSVLASANSPRMTRPPGFGWPAAGAVPRVGPIVGPGTLGLAALVGSPLDAAAGLDVAPAALVAGAAAALVGDDGVGWVAGPQAATTSMPAVRVDTMRPLARVNKSIEALLSDVPWAVCQSH